MKVYKYFPPYKAAGKTRFPETRNLSGCYLIKENGKIVYVGSSTVNLYKTLYRHFQRWNHRYQNVTTYKDRLNDKKYTIRLIVCTAARAIRLERALIKKYRPRDNDEKYQAYQLDFRDNETVEFYENAPVLLENPF